VIKQILVSSDAPDGLDRSPNMEFRLAPGVVLVTVTDGSSRLLDFGGSFYGLSAVGTELLTLTLKKGCNDAVQAVSEAWSVAESQVSRDLTLLLNNLHQRRLISTTASPASTRDRSVLGTFVATCLSAAISFFTTDNQIWLILLTAFASLRLLGWNRTLCVWTQFVASRQESECFGDSLSDVQIDTLTRDVASRHLLRTECKERSLTFWLLMRLRGRPAELVVGLDLYPLASHCWCEIGTKIYTDFDDSCRRYTPILRYR
jgi:Transglutaminase-like superfamily